MTDKSKVLELIDDEIAEITAITRDCDSVMIVSYAMQVGALQKLRHRVVEEI